MLFNSLEFILVFLPFVIIGYYSIAHFIGKQSSRQFLVLASLFFYAWWDISYLPILFASMVFNFFVSKQILLLNGKLRIYMTIFGVLANLALLGYFKYLGFIVTNINLLFERTDDVVNLILPLGISFFTFQQIAYLIDCKTGNINKSKHEGFTSYSLFICFFPQLIAGPIVHHKEMMPQFTGENYKFNVHNFNAGLLLFSIGLFKKVIVADTFAIWANEGFNGASSLSFMDAWLTSLSYSTQLYFDFSGYCDMAMGIALMLNINLPLNFNSPYKSLNIQDFWRRWHITLGRFLRDYIYIPLGGNKGNSFNAYSNLFITFLIGGIWHGAGWNFVAWGCLHGAALVVHRLWKATNINLGVALNWFITFNFINLCWVFFRSETIEQSLSIISVMFKFDTSTLDNYMQLTYVISALVFILLLPNAYHITMKLKNSSARLLITTVALTLSLMHVLNVYFDEFASSEFLYFQF